MLLFDLLLNIELVLSTPEISMYFWNRRKDMIKMNLCSVLSVHVLGIVKCQVVLGRQGSSRQGLEMFSMIKLRFYHLHFSTF